MENETVYELFSRRANEAPGKVAIDSHRRSITYRELEARSTSLANRLVASGAEKGSIVAIASKDSALIITAILGILKAGCVYVPLDPDFPPKRLESMISLVSPGWFIFESRSFDGFALSHIIKGPRSKTIYLDETPAGHEQVFLDAQTSDSNGKPPAITADSEAMCCVYFTSGSTGKPKGIAGRLSGISHFVKWEIAALGVNQDSRVSQLTPASFDGFLKDAFVPLCAGGAVCVPESKETILDAGKLVDWLNRQKISILHCVPSVFRAILNQDLKPEYFSRLKHVVLAGERLLPFDVGKWIDVFGDRIQLVNLYGPTETTITKLFYFVSPSDRERRSIPIGKPMDGAAALIVDDEGKPCPARVVGEILIRTPYRALGYFDQPDLTKEAFIQNPFGEDPNDIVYRTGDLGRVLEDGNFDFVGRRDHQVKIRGVRIELGEIENLLRGHEAVKDVAVIDREDSTGNKYLAAYVVLRSQISISVLKDYLSAYLPDYMMPSACVLLEALPRTPNGKLDRSALPNPGQAQVAAGEAYASPRTPMEEALAAIWGEVLNLERVSIHGNFFDLGGHSLLATQLLSRVRAVLQIEMHLRHLFEAPTIAELALVTTQLQAEHKSEDEMTKLLLEIGSLSDDDMEDALSTETQLAKSEAE